MKYKNFIRKILPPFIYEWIIGNFSRSHVWEGNFKTWNEAKQITTGYESPEILQKVLKTMLYIKNSDNAFEKDGQVNRLPQRSWPLLFGLINAALRDQKLCVLDIGGSLGTSYHGNKKLIPQSFLKSFQWNVIEQAHMVTAGRQHMEDRNLRFFNTIEESLMFSQPNCILLSNSLQYLPDPLDILYKINELDASIIILDKVAITDEFEARICIQKVKSSIYCASYPMHILTLDSIINHLNRWQPIAQIEDTLQHKLTKEGFKIRYFSILLERR